MKLLDMRAFELKSAVHDVFDYVWNSLVWVDKENGKTAIFQAREGILHIYSSYDASNALQTNR